MKLDNSNQNEMSRGKRFWWAIGRAALFVAVFVGFQSQLSVIITTVYSVMAGGEMSETALINEIMQWSSMIAAVGGVLTIITVLLVLYVRDYSPTEELGLVSPARGITLLQAALLGIGACGAVSLLLSTIPFPESWVESYTQSAEAVAGGNPILDILATVIVAPLSEEIVFRGMVYRSLKRGMPPIAAVIVTSAVFGILHGTIVWFVYTALLSVMLIFLYEYAQSLWAPILAHMTFNIVGQLPLLFEEGPMWINIAYVYGCLGVFAGALVWTLRSRKKQRTAPPAPTPLYGGPQQ